MPLVRLKAIKALRYQTRAMAAGDEFTADPRDARIFQLLGRAEAVMAPPRSRGRPVQQTVTGADDVEAPRSRLYRMRKEELADILRGLGQEVDLETEGRHALLERALASTKPAEA